MFVTAKDFLRVFCIVAVVCLPLYLALAYDQYPVLVVDILVLFPTHVYFAVLCLAYFYCRIS